MHCATGGRILALGDCRPLDTRTTITSVEFRSYKAFRHYSLQLQQMNILVGPNNSGKSTVIGAFRLLANALRHARSRQTQYLIGPRGRRYYGYVLPAEDLPVSIENVHTDYAETDSVINFRLSNGNNMQLYFPRSGGILLLLDPVGKDVRTTASFKNAYPINIAAVPVLGPLEHEEDFVQLGTVQRGLETHRASRHFRSYWRYYPGGFTEFAELVAKTWPGMQIEEPELDHRSNKLSMFCLEDRITRELYWSGFGFQIWCQLLTHIFRAKRDALLIVDEPEIYLHPDVQRQLLAIVRDIGPDVILATHSTEIMSEADPAEIVLVDKSDRSGERLRDVAGVQIALQKVGSIQNITLTRLARNRTILFVESADDFVLLRRFARKLGLAELSAGVDLTPTESDGFSHWKTISDFAWGVKKTLTTTLKIGAIFDRDYWPDEELQEIQSELSKSLQLVHVHRRKEIENYLLVPSVLAQTIRGNLGRQAEKSTPPAVTDEDVEKALARITETFRTSVQSQIVARRTEFLRRKGSKLDGATIMQETLHQFESDWGSLERRLEIVPGKEVLRMLRDEMQTKYGATLTGYRIVESFRRNDVPGDLVDLLNHLDEFRRGARLSS
jgi:energy-coupling factor transporter ATP-binding protein EcfA2